MVVSKIDNSINYPEIRGLNNADKDQDEVWTYETEINGQNIDIALGKPNYSFIKKNVIYFPAYLIINSKVDSQIGVYEIRSNTLPNILDEDGDIDLNKLNEPRIYSYTNSLLQEKKEKILSEKDKEVERKISSYQEDEEDEEDEEDDEEEEEEDEDEEDEDEEDKKIKEEFISNMYSRNKYLINNNISETQFTEKIKEEIKKQEKKDYNDFIKLVRSIKVFTFSIIFISFGIVILSQRK